MEMIEVTGGTVFYMGVEGAEKDWVISRDGRPTADIIEWPRHPVKVSSFLIGKYEVTQGQFKAVMGFNPSPAQHQKLSNADYRPVTKVSWYNAIRFCNALSAKHGYSPVYTITGDYLAPTVTIDYGKNGYRLPTEAEWEYAAEGGNKTRGYTFSGGGLWSSPDEGVSELKKVAWYIGNSGGVPQVVGTKDPNELGIHDMSGNAWEWAANYWHLYKASTTPLVDPVLALPSKGSGPMVRGGTYSSLAANCRVSLRGGVPAGGSEIHHELPLDNSGFRVVRRP